MQLSNKPSSVQSRGQLMLALAIFLTIYSHHGPSLCNGQQFQQQRQSNGAPSLLVSQNPSGGISIVDPASNRQIVNTNGLEVNGNDEVVGGDLDSNPVVAGLLDWLDKKKKKKEKQPIILPYPMPQPMPMPMPQPLPQPLPMPMPMPMPMPVPEPYHHHHKHQRKEIHIHINNHIKKAPHKKHHGGHKKHGYHYEDYHDGHYGHDYHDKYYHGKHSYPLLGHHLSFDHFEHYGGDHHGHVGHGDHHGDDDYSGYESKSVAQYAANNNSSSSATGASKQNDDQTQVGGA